MPKQKMRCRAGLRYNEQAGTYDQCCGERYTEEHDKLHPAQASAKQTILDEAGPWRDRHPLADTDLSVTEDEWDALAAEGHFSPCRIVHYDNDKNDPAPAASPSVGTLFRNRKLRGTFRAVAPVDSFQDEIVLFAACVFLFLVATWAFGAIAIFATPTSVFVTLNFPVQTASVVTWSPIYHTCAVGTCLSMTILLSVLLGGLVV
jgi:hypothetical protein